MTRLAPAKINLHLAIEGKRPDGYHNLSSIMIKVGLFDIVTVESSKEGIRVLGNPCVAESDDLMFMAASTFCKQAGVGDGVSIRICKRIPSGAGLGGGSSDAAAVLMALDTMYPGVMARSKLLELAADIGSDVPFFLGGNIKKSILIGTKCNCIKALFSIYRK